MRAASKSPHGSKLKSVSCFNDIHMPRCLITTIFFFFFFVIVFECEFKVT